MSDTIQIQLIDGSVEVVTDIVHQIPVLKSSLEGESDTEFIPVTLPSTKMKGRNHATVEAFNKIIEYITLHADDTEEEKKDMSELKWESTIYKISDKDMQWSDSIFQMNDDEVITTMLGLTADVMSLAFYLGYIPGFVVLKTRLARHIAGRSISDTKRILCQPKLEITDEMREKVLQQHPKIAGFFKDVKEDEEAANEESDEDIESVIYCFFISACLVRGSLRSIISGSSLI